MDMFMNRFSGIMSDGVDEYQLGAVAIAVVVDCDCIRYRYCFICFAVNQQNRTGYLTGCVYWGNIVIAVSDDEFDVANNPGREKSRYAKSRQIAAHHPLWMCKCGHTDYRRDIVTP